MGKYDNYDRDYFGERERFAELFTYGYFHQRLVVPIEGLMPAETRYQSLRTPSGTIQRDIKYFCKNIKAYMALEIEIKIDHRMPERFLVYDASEYEKQIKEISKQKEASEGAKNYSDIKSGFNKDDRLYPVLNLVLYLGQGHWNGKRSLKDMFHYDEDSQDIIYNM